MSSSNAADLGETISSSFEEITTPSKVANGRFSALNIREKLTCRNVAIALIALAIVGLVIGIFASGGFGPEGWLQQTALPAIKTTAEHFAHWVTDTALPSIRHALDTKTQMYHLSIGEVLATTVAPVIGASILTVLIAKGIQQRIHFTRETVKHQNFIKDLLTK